MKELSKYLFKKKWIILVSLLFSFCFGFFLGNIYNYNFSYYRCDFTITNIDNFQIDKLTDIDYLNKIKDSGYNEKTQTNKYSNIDIEKMLKNRDFKVVLNEDKSITITTPYKYYDVFFVSSSKSLSSRAKTFIRDAVNNLANEEIVTYKYGNDIITINNYVNKTIVGLCSLAIGGIIALSICISLYFKKIENKDNFIYDNQNTYKSIFHKKYWIDSFNAIKKTKDLTIISLIFALILICKLIPIPSGFGDLGLSFTYLFIALIGVIYGPIYGFLIGTLSDTIGFFINSSGFFFFGYTLQAALTGMIYGLLFYKTKINFSKVLVCRVIINLFMNVLLGSLCYTIVFTKFSLFSKDFNDFLFSYITLLSLPKNIIYLLPQSLFLFYFIKLVSPILYSNHLINKNIYDHIRVF